MSTLTYREASKMLIEKKNIHYWNDKKHTRGVLMKKRGGRFEIHTPTKVKRVTKKQAIKWLTNKTKQYLF